MKLRAALVSLLLLVSLSCCLYGCHETDKPAEEFSNYETIADLATIECYYHNVAEIYNPGTDYLFHFVNVGYKKAWFEYRGSVEMGVDANKVSITSPDEDGVVIITVPDAQVLGLPKVDEGSFSEVYSDTGFVQKITIEDMTDALNKAQENMKTEAESDAVLMRQAKSRAKLLLKQYILNVGEAKGVVYKVKFKDYSEDGKSGEAEGL